MQYSSEGLIIIINSSKLHTSCHGRPLEGEQFLRGSGEERPNL